MLKLHSLVQSMFKAGDTMKNTLQGLILVLIMGAVSGAVCQLITGTLWQSVIAGGLVVIGMTWLLVGIKS
jgi:hypothetical protein